MVHVPLMAVGVVYVPLIAVGVVHVPNGSVVYVPLMAVRWYILSVFWKELRECRQQH